MTDLFIGISDWWSQIDWSATGSMISAIGTCVAAFFAYLIAKRQNKLTGQIADKQFKQAELGQKIALYDKRYEVYSLFSKYIYIGNIFIHQKKELTPELNKMLLEQVYFDNESDREALTNKFVNLGKIVTDPQKQALAQMLLFQGTYSKNTAEYNKSKIEIGEIHKKIENMDYTFAEKQILKIRMAEFCYPIEIAIPIIKYISLIFSPEAYQKHELNRDKILSVFNEIKEKCITSKMKDLLKLSYENIDVSNPYKEHQT